MIAEIAARDLDTFGAARAVLSQSRMMREHCVVLLTLVVWITVALLALLVNAPLGHDESQYAVAARATSSPWLYLPPGTVAIAQVGTSFGDAAWVLRLVPIVLGVGFLLSVWWLGRVVFGAHVGAFAAAIIAGAHPLALHSAELLGDLPAAALVLLGIGIIVRTIDTRSWHLLAVAPVFAAAFYIRYGTAPIIAIIAMTTLCLWWRAIAARPWPVVATACVFVVLLVPHAIHSLHATGSVFGIVRLGAGVPYRGYIGEGLVTYVTSDPFMFYGVLATPVMIAGLASLVRPPRRWRPTALFVIVAIGQIVTLGLETRAQPRYVAVAVVLLVIAGVDVAVRVLRTRPRALLRMVELGQVAVALAWFGTLIAVVPRNLMLARARAPLELAAAAIRADSAGRPCVVAGSNLPQIMWRTRCTGVIATPRTRWPADRVGYLVALPPEVPRVATLARDVAATTVTVPQLGARPLVWHVP